MFSKISLKLKEKIQGLKDHFFSKEEKITRYGEKRASEETYIGDLVTDIKDRVQEISLTLMLPKNKVRLEWIKKVKRAIAFFDMVVFGAMAVLTFKDNFAIFLIVLSVSLIALDDIWRMRN